MFLQSVHFPTNAFHNTTYLTHIKPPTCGTQAPSSGSYYNKGISANLLICLFIVISLIKTSIVKIYKMYKIYKIDIVNNLQCFDNKLIISRLLRCQLLVSVF